MSITLTPEPVHTNLVNLISAANEIELNDEQVEFVNPVSTGMAASIVVKATKGKGYINGPLFPNGITIDYPKSYIYDGTTTHQWSYTLPATTTFLEVRTLVAQSFNVPVDDIECYSLQYLSAKESGSLSNIANDFITLCFGSVGGTMDLNSEDGVVFGTESKIIGPSAIAISIKLV